jgi:hypothetical protein
MSDEKLPVKTEVHGKGVAAWHPNDVQQAFVVHTTLPQDTPEQRFAVLSMIEGETLSGETCIGCEFELSHYIVHPVTFFNEETGEVVEARRTLLLQEGQPPIAFVSDGILRSIGRIAYASGQLPPFKPPIKVKLKQVSGKGPRRTYKLIPISQG